LTDWRSFSSGVKVNQHVRSKYAATLPLSQFPIREVAIAVARH
jgi:hypothetical protein